LNEALKLAAQVAAGLEAAHRVGVVHRDLKPANVLVTPSGSVKLVDFGIAKRLEPAGVTIAEAQTVAARPNTGAWQILGTVAYMSPEQARGEAIDARSDLFSFGTLLYEMLTGHRPFDAENDVATLAAILHREPTPPSVLHAGLPREVERIVLRCLRKDRERRFQTASDLKLSLEDLQNETATTEAKPATVSTRRSIASAALVIGVCLAAIGAAAYYFSGTDDHGARPALRQLTFEAGVAITPALSPDGRLLAYASDRSAEGQLDIWLKQVAGGEPVRLTSGPDSK
jgi:serine/threonine protein kinase